MPISTVGVVRRLAKSNHCPGVEVESSLSILARCRSGNGRGCNPRIGGSIPPWASQSYKGVCLKYGSTPVWKVTGMDEDTALKAAAG